MRHLYLFCLLLLGFLGSTVSASAQTCDLTKPSLLTQIQPASYPYTTASGITVSARLVGTYAYSMSLSYTSCDSPFRTAATSWHIGLSPTDSIILTFSSPVYDFAFIYNATNENEVVSVLPSTGSVTLSDFCTGSFTLESANALKCTTVAAAGTVIRVNNPVGATRYVIKHNGVGSGSLLNLVTCFNGATLKGPADITTGIQLWLNGSDVTNNPGTNPADSSKLGIWKDVSGNGNHAYVLSGQDTPLLRSNRINSKDAVQFKRTSGSRGTIYYVPDVDIRAGVMPQSTIFTVYRQGAHGTAELQGIWGNDNGAWDRFFMPVYNSDNGVVSVGPPINNVPIANSGVPGEVRLLTAVFDNAKTDSSTIYFNAVPVGTTTDNTHVSAAQTNFRIGWDGDDNPYNGDMAEVILYNRKLSLCEIKEVNRYLGYKYGAYFTTATITPNTTQYICNDSATLTASSGSSYQWLRNGTPISGATSLTYKAGTAGSYRVVIGSGICADTSAPLTVAEVPGTIYVDSSIAVSGAGGSWTTAKKTLTEALTIANRVNCPIAIWVKKGTYYPTTNGSRDSAFMILRNNIKIYGGFSGTESTLSARSVSANPTILSGDIGVANDSTDNSYHVMLMIAAATKKIDTATILDGFMLTRGNGLGIGGNFNYGGVSLARADGAAIELYGGGAGNNCSPLIANCTFTRNAANYGGAIYAGGISTGMSNPLIHNCTFSNNRANNSGGAVIINGQSSGNVAPVLENCSFNSNTASDGGAFYILRDGAGAANSSIRNCSFSDNRVSGGGGAIGSYQSSGTISNSQFIRNIAAYSGGAIQCDGGTYILNNNLLDSNAATIGGAVRMYPGNPSVKAYKNVFYRNVSTAADAGAMSLVNGTGTDTLINNLFIRNKVSGTSSLNNGGGALVQEGGASSFIVNNTFYADSSSVSGGAIHFKDGGANRYLYNNIFYKNKGGTTATTDMSFASGAAITAQSNNTFSTTNPLFVNEALPLGTDGIWKTADDGLQLRPCSPAADSGLNSVVVVTDDITGAARIQFTTVDRGAYEERTHLLPIAPTTTTAITYCQGVTAATLTATTAATSDTLKWYNAVPALLPGAPTPATTDTGTFTYYVSVMNIAGCETEKTRITVRVNTTPAIPTSVTPVVYCQNATATALTATVATSGDTLKWYNAVPAALATAPTPVTTATGSTTYYVSARNGLACESAKRTITVTVNPTPGTPAATTPIVYCQGATATALTATPVSSTDTLKWYDAVPAALSGAPTPATAAAGSTTYYVSGKNGFGCESPQKAITVTVNSTPAAPVATSPVVYCQNAGATALTATKALAADTLKWYDATPALLSGAPTPATTTPGLTTYYVSEKTGAGCEGPRTTITVRVNPTPATPTASSPVVYCQGVTPVVLTASAALGSDTLRWFDASSTLLPAAPTPATASAGSTTYYVSAKNSFNCESPKKTIVVTVNATPAAPVSTSPVTYCQDDVAVALSATKALAADTLRWYTASVLLPGAPTPATSVPGTTTYYVSEKTALNCEGPKTTINVIVNPKPAAPVVVSPIDICVGITPAPLSATGTNLKWYAAASGGTGTATRVPAASSTGTTSYFVSQTTALGCEGPRAELKVNVRPSPVVSIAPHEAPAFVYCHGADITIKASSATATSYQWYRNDLVLSGDTDDSLVISTTADYSVIVKDVYGCADTEKVTVIENPLPVPTLSPNNVSICPGVSIMLYASPASSLYTYEWKRDGVPMSVPGTESHTPVSNTGLYSVRVTDIYNCVITTNNASVNRYPAMTTPVIDGSRSPLLTLTSTYASYQWYRNGKLIPGANSRSYTITFDGDYSVEVMDANGCTATSTVYQARSTGIDEQTAGSQVRLYPNPTQNRVTIEATQPVKVRVTDVTGRVILEQQQARMVDLEAYADGIYLFTILSKDNIPVLIQTIQKHSR